MTVVPPSALLTGQLIDHRYRIGEVIGRGAMSEVYRAEDVRLGRTVALKALRSGVPDRDRFEEETALLCSLDHPNLVRLHDAGEHDGTPYLVLNLLDRTLTDDLRAGPVPADRIARVGSEIASALQYLHDNGVVHRDIKPSNILLRSDGTACLADLGAALSLDGPRLTATGMTIGTPMYLAPEQAMTGEVTAAADIYSLGLVLLEAVTGAPAFTGTQQETLAARITRPPLVPPEVPPPLRAELVSMVAVDPGLRPTAAEAGAHLSRLSHDLVGFASRAGDELDTVVLAAPTMVGPVVSPAGDTQQFTAARAAIAPPGAPFLARARDWFTRDRDRVIWAGLAVLLALGLLVGLASADGGLAKDPPADTVPTTVATTLPATTVPVTIAPAPPPENTCQGDCGNGRDEGRKDKDDKD